MSRLPVFEQRHRMALALEHAGLSVQEMALDLGLNPSTVSRYLSGKKRTPRSVTISWAMRCGVPVVWLVTGHEAPDPEHPAARFDEARYGVATYADEEQPASTIWNTHRRWVDRRLSALPVAA